MNENENAWIGNAFAGLENLRQAMNQRHKFVDVLVIAIGATICGADSPSKPITHCYMKMSPNSLIRWLRM